MSSGSFGSSRTSVSLANDFSSYTFLEAFEEVEVTPAEAYWLGLPISNIADHIIDNGRALGGFTGSNSQFSTAAATRSSSPSYGLIHSSYSNNHLMSTYPRSVLIQNHHPAVEMYYARNSTSPYAWSSTGYNNWSLSGDVGFGYANPGYVRETVAGTLSGSSYGSHYALQPAIYSTLPNQQLQPANYSGFFNHELLQPANYYGFFNFELLQPEFPNLVGHGSQEFGTTLVDPLASSFEQDPRQHTNTILGNAFEQPPAIAQGMNFRPPQSANLSEGPHYVIASTISHPFVADANGYLSEFEDLDAFPQELMESQDSSPNVHDANTGMDEYFERGDYLIDDFDGFDSADPSDLFID